MVECHFSGDAIVIKSDGIFDLIVLKSLFTDEKIKAREEKPPTPDRAEEKRKGNSSLDPCSGEPLCLHRGLPEIF